MDVIIVHFVFVALLFSDFYRYGVGQPEMLLPASQIVLGSTVPVSSEFLCRIDSGISINLIFQMQILRMRDSLDSDFVPIVQATSSGVSFVTTAPADMLERGTVGGGLDSATLTSSTLTLTLTTEDIVCTDKGTYQCLLNYQDSQSASQVVVNNATLDTYALPSDVVLTARLNNADVTNDGPEADPLEVNVNDAVEFTCTAKIGSDKNTLIKWKRTSPLVATNTFNPFNPNGNPSVVTFSVGTPSDTTTDCSYSRNATMTYNVTSVETSRQNDLAFQCYIEVTVNGQNYTTHNPPEFYINPVTSDVTTPSVATITTGLTTPSAVTITSDVTTPSEAARVMPARSFFILMIMYCVVEWVAATMKTLI